jgi:hypothetical protein
MFGSCMNSAAAFFSLFENKGKKDKTAVSGVL